MSKMFYSVEETAQKLGKSEDEVRMMASSGALEEFREGNDLVFKAEQVDLLAGDDDEELSLDLDGGLDLADSSTGASGMGLADSEIDLGESALDLSSSGVAGESSIPLDADIGSLDDASSGDSTSNDGRSDDSTSDVAATNEASAGGSAFDLAESDMDLTLADSGASASSFDLGDDGDDSSDENPMEQTGVSIFGDDGDEADPSAATFVADGAPAIDLNADQLEGVGSGSGLLDLTQEGDDTSLGVDLLDDGFGGGDASAMGSAMQPAEDGGGLFEATEAAGGDDIGGAAVMAQPMVAYDGGGSGLVLGLSIGVAVAVLFAGGMTIMSSAGVGVGSLIQTLGGEWWIPAAAIAGVTLIGGVLGFVFMKKG